MGSLIRAGVEPDTAAQITGLDGVKFIAGRPITLRYEDQ